MGSAVIPLRDDNPTSRRAIVTLVLMALCAVVYFAVQPSPFAATNADSTFYYAHAAIPFEVVHHRPITACEAIDKAKLRIPRSQTCDVPIAPKKHVWLAMVWSIFLHGSIMHLLGNLLFFWTFGNNVEDRLGRIVFPIFYVAGGLVATATHIAFHRNDIAPVVGASGAIAALMGAYLVWWPRARVSTLLFGFFPATLRAGWVLAAWFVMQFFTGSASGVAWIAHVGGFVFGALVALPLRVLRPRRSEPRSAVYRI